MRARTCAAADTAAIASVTSTAIDQLTGAGPAGTSSRISGAAAATATDWATRTTIGGAGGLAAVGAFAGGFTTGFSGGRAKLSCIRPWGA